VALRGYLQQFGDATLGCLRRSLGTEAVAQTLREVVVRPFVRVGSENGHLIRHGRLIRREVVAQRLLSRAVPRAHRGFSETALCDSLDEQQQPRPTVLLLDEGGSDARAAAPQEQ
jgi:hypothetical protein